MTAPHGRDHHGPGATPVDRGRIRADIHEVTSGVADAARRSSPRVGDVRIIAVDGLSGAGKSTLAQSLAALLDASIIHLDDVYRGWGGLGEVGLHLRDWVIRPLTEGRDPRWHPWDWLADAPSEEWLQIPRSEFLVVEGCGSAAAEIETATALVVWVEAPRRELDTRLRGRPDWTWYEAHLPKLFEVQ